ncbi:MAG: glycoside hydrolase family 2 protein, partial [Maioricimonas sp. JB049]
MKPTLLSLLALVLLQSSAAAEVPIVDTWKYTFRRPAEGWRTADFDEAGWKSGPGGFGTPETPGSRVGTYWQTNNIWLRKPFELESVPEQPALLIHHDEDAQVFINGRRAAAFEGYVTEYKVVPLDEQAKTLLRKGENVLAVHCRQTAGGQFIDVHVVDGRNVPELPPAQRSMKPFESELITKWGAEVTPENAWTEYPRPQLRRNEWQNLNGQWEYAITKAGHTDVPDEWAGEILVPFCLESKLGGVQRLLDPDEALWYRRTFEASAGDGERMLLHFEAVDYECEVWVNGTSVGTHRGGNTAFSFDVTDALQDGDNELLVRVEDDTEQWQLRGKQTLSPRGIWYTQVSGIWQTVWLEPVPEAFIDDLTIGTDADRGSITIRTDIAGQAEGASVRVIVKDGNSAVADGRGNGEAMTIDVPDAKLWSPSSPHLYSLEVSLVDDAGQVLDRVESYAGIRTVGKTVDDEGHLRFTLNGETISHWGPLDQGWWPDGLLTPPSDEAMVFELEFLKKAGFNMLRK